MYRHEGACAAEVPHSKDPTANVLLPKSRMQDTQLHLHMLGNALWSQGYSH